MGQRIMRTLKGFAGVGALLVATASCGDVVRTGRSPVMLVMNLLQGAPTGGHGAGTFTGTLFSDVIVLVTSPAPCTPTSPCPSIFADVGSVQLTAVMKDVGSPQLTTTPTTNNQVTVNRIHVKYVRADGRNVQGVDVPYEFDGAATGTVGVGGTLSLTFELVRHAAKEESPLVQLINSPSVITTIAQVTFYGKDQVGNDVSVSGNIQIDFGNFGDQ